MSERKKVSIKDIAAEIPCSPSTVSIVLNDKGNEYRISLETQNHIKKTAARMGYSAKSKAAKGASFASLSRPITIGVFMGLVNHAPFGHMLKGLSERTKYGNRAIEFCVHPYAVGTLNELEPILLNNQYDGLILIPTGKQECNYLKTIDIKIPCVVMSQSIAGYNCVVPDRIECGALVARLFIAKGFKKIGLVTKSSLSESGQLRTFGFTSTYEKEGHPDARITAVEDKTDGDYGFSGMNQLLGKMAEDPPEAIFVTEPNNFSGTINSLRQHGMIPLKNLDIVVFGNYSDNAINQCLDPSITTIGVPVTSMMIDSIDLVCHQIEGGILHMVTKMHHPELSFRESCTKPENWDSGF